MLVQSKYQSIGSHKSSTNFVQNIISLTSSQHLMMLMCLLNRLVKEEERWVRTGSLLMWRKEENSYAAQIKVVMEKYDGPHKSQPIIAKCRLQ